MGYWENISKDRKIRMKMMDLDREMPGILSHEMIAFTIEVEIRVKRDAGFEFFRSLYESRKEFIIDTFIHRGSTNHFMHIALGRSLAKDTDNTRVLELHDAYKNAMARCKIDKTLSVQQMYITRLRLGFWYGRLHILRCEESELDTAIEIWEDLLKDFFRNPSVADVEIVLPIATHLCSAYIRKALQSTASIESAGIIAKVTDMYETAVFSQDPLTLKLRFRLGLCLARLHMVCDHPTEARYVLREHALSAFAMINQTKTLPLASIGWFYLASILTMLSHEQAAWAWSKVQPHQPDRWSSYSKQNKNSRGKNVFGNNPPLKNEMRIRLDARSEAFDTYCKPLHIPAEWSPSDISGLPPAQRGLRKVGEIHGRISYWVCKDCMLSKLCITCRSSLKEGQLTPMGCDKSHNGVLVPASDGCDFPNAVTQEDWEVVGMLQAYLTAAV